MDQRLLRYHNKWTGGWSPLTLLWFQLPVQVRMWRKFCHAWCWIPATGLIICRCRRIRCFSTISKKWTRRSSAVTSKWFLNYQRQDEQELHKCRCKRKRYSSAVRGYWPRGLSILAASGLVAPQLSAANRPRVCKLSGGKCSRGPRNSDASKRGTHQLSTINGRGFMDFNGNSTKGPFKS